jgi:CMP-N-acetylneuraminic acid synthetase
MPQSGKDPASVAYIIQARLGSARLPRKMLRPFAGTTLLDIALEKIKRSSRISLDRFYLAVHEDELVAVGRRHGVQVFHRSAKSAAGEDLLDVYEWHDRLPCDYVVKINACAPLLSVETIDTFVTTYLESHLEGLFGVVEEHDYFWNADGVMVTPWPSGLSIMNTKRVEATYRAAHCLYAGRRQRISSGIWMGTFRQRDDPALFPMRALEAFDIDVLWQFEMCEAYYERLHARLSPAHAG